MKSFFGLLLLVVANFVYAQSAEELVQAKLNALHSMSASFKQVVNAKARVISRSSGTMALLRPGRFRWQTKAPMEQLVVADGKHLYIYDKALEQVTVKAQDKGLGGTAALFLSGYSDSVARDFVVSEQDKGQNQIFDMKSKSSKANFQRIKLIFSKELLTGLELHDQLGQITHVTLSQIKANPNLVASLFQFKPPKGVDVVQQ